MWEFSDKLRVFNNPDPCVSDPTKDPFRVIEIQTLQIIQRDPLGSGHLLDVASSTVLVFRKKTHEAEPGKRLHVRVYRFHFFLLDPYRERAISAKAKCESQAFPSFWDSC